jgi:LysR family transcriptional regulator of gallate degradation
MPEFATTLLDKRPGVRLRLFEMAPSALLPMVREEALDLALAHRTHDNLDAGLRYRPLFEIQMRVAARPGHPMAGRNLEMDELANCQWLSMAAPGSSNNFVTQTFKAAGVTRPSPVVHCNAYSLALDLIAATDLVTVLPPAKLRECVAAGLLVELALTQAMAPLQLGLYTRVDAPISPAARVASQIIVAIAKRKVLSGELRSTEPIADVASAQKLRVASCR